MLQSNFGQEMEKKNAVQRGSSVGSSNASNLGNSFGMIHNILNSKRTPVVIKSLYFSMLFEFVTFLILVVLYGSILGNYLDNYTFVQIRLCQGAKIQIPLWRTMHLVSRKTMSNLGILDDLKSRGNLSKIITDQQRLFLQEFKVFLRTETERGHDHFYFDLKNEINFDYINTDQNEDVSFIGFIMKISSNLKSIETGSFSNGDLSFNQTDVKLILENFLTIKDNFDQINMRLLDQEEDKKNELNIINIYCLIAAIGFLFMSTTLTLPAYVKYNRSLERTLRLITRVTERDAEEELTSLHNCKSLLLTTDQKFMNIDYSNLNPSLDWRLKLDNMNDLDKSQSLSSKGERRIKTKHLSDRIKVQNLPRLRFVLISLLIFSLGSTFYVTIFVFVNQFHPYIEPYVKTYVKYLDRSTDSS